MQDLTKLRENMSVVMVVAGSWTPASQFSVTIIGGRLYLQLLIDNLRRLEVRDRLHYASLGDSQGSKLERTFRKIEAVSSVPETVSTSLRNCSASTSSRCL